MPAPQSLSQDLSTSDISSAEREGHNRKNRECAERLAQALGDRLHVPETPEAAKAALPVFTQRCLDAYQAYQAAKAELIRCRGEMTICRDVANGSFSLDQAYAVSSRGPWRVA